MLAGRNFDDSRYRPSQIPQHQQRTLPKPGPHQHRFPNKQQILDHVSTPLLSPTSCSQPTSNLTLHSYIYGGAWWRPMITSNSFTLTVSSLLQSPFLSLISGFESLNYRLSTPSPLPQFAQFTQSHPAHLNDIEPAITYLQAEYRFRTNYVLVGHFCGVALAFQITRLEGKDGKGVWVQREYCVWRESMI